MSETTDLVVNGAQDDAGTSEAPAASGTAGRTRRRGSGLAGMLLPELQRLAADLGIAGTARMRKGDLVAAISARQVGGGAATGAVNGDPAPAATPAATPPVTPSATSGAPDRPVDVGAPDARGDAVVPELDLDRDRLECEAELLGIVPRILLDLPAGLVDRLPEVAGAVEEPDPDERDAEVGGRLQVVSGEDAEAARVDRQPLVEPELGAEVRDQHGGIFSGRPRAGPFDPARGRETTTCGRAGRRSSRRGSRRRPVSAG